MNIPATGKQIKVAHIAIYRLENGKVVENWVQMDMLSMMQQLGVIPQPEQAGV
jgi:predicted ester cyclase